MKKLTALFLSAFLAISLSACGAKTNEAVEIGIPQPETLTYDTSAEKSETSSAQLSETLEQTTVSETSKITESEENTSSETVEITEAEQTVSETESQTELTEQTTASETTTKTETQTETSVQTTAEAPVVTEPEKQEGKTLVAYFSWSGNTREMAEYIEKQTGGDIFEIIPKTPYPEDYTECTEVALAERDGDMRPEIKDLPDNIDEYDTVIIGYPIWWHTAPMIIGTFLESYDLTNVEVYPFTQSASMDEEQFENSMDFVRSCSGKGNVHDGLFASAGNTSAIDSYLSENGLVK